MRTAILKVKFLKTGLICLIMLWHFAAEAQPIPLPNAFAHNDYFHERPLYDALDNGYTHIEADVFLYNGKLVVAHHNPIFKCKRERTLEALYLQPLLQLSQTPGGPCIGYDKPVVLMLDIKTRAERTYKALVPLLAKYKAMLTHYDNGRLVNRAVTIVLSGNRPHRVLLTDTLNLVFVDADLTRAHADTAENKRYAMASCKYKSLLKWTGTGPIPPNEQTQLKAYVDAAHKNGRKVRLWSSPDNSAVWQELLNCGVDLINTDKLAQLRDFLTNYWPRSLAQNGIGSVSR